MAKKSKSKQKEKLFEQKLVPAKPGSNKLFDVSYGDETQPVECLGMTFENDEARRQYFLEKLREKLKDPEFRQIEGFPIGEDEDILTLSDPPYYTACPNPFLDAFVRCYGTPYDASDNYTTESFATDVKSGKGDQSYYIHSYHTKVPPSAVAKFIDHYAAQNDLVLDCFAGSGMTGVGSTLVKGRSVGVLLIDLAVSAGFISYFHNLFRPTERQAEFVAQAFRDAQKEFANYNETAHTGWLAAAEAPEDPATPARSGKAPVGTVKYTVWTDMIQCPECAHEMSLWDEVVHLPSNTVVDDFNCPKCGVLLTKQVKGAKAKGAAIVERATETVYDDALRTTVQRVKRTPVLISYNYAGTRYEKYPDKHDLARIEQAESDAITNWFPTDAIPPGDKTGDPLRVGITHVHQYYPRRTLHALSFLSERLRAEPGLIGFVTAILTRCSWQNRYMPQHRGNRSREVVGPLSGTLYIPSFALEINPVEYGQKKSEGILRRLGKIKRAKAIVSTESASSLSQTLHETIDYVFIDPPFGANLQYSELSYAMESWLRVVTHSGDEMVVNKSQGKDLLDYGNRMRDAFCSVYEAIKPGRWVTIEFHNSQNAVWNVIQNAVSESGMVVADVRILDKVKGTTKQLTQANTVKQDLIITAYRPAMQLEERFKVEAGSEDAVWEFIRSHLHQLPVFVSKNGVMEVLGERQNYLLFDRMIAFHVQRGVAVPISAAEFYATLREKFPERDGMFFLPDQVSEYDKKRLTVSECLQLDLFVTNEMSAIQWIKRTLTQKTPTFQELQPLFMRELAGWEKHEKHLELWDLLKENFLCYDGIGDVPSQIHSYLSSNFHDLRNLDKDHPNLVAKANNRWYVPDHRKEADLEKVRHRHLMKEYEQYQDSKGKLKLVRSEALRAGFKECWQNGDYQTIVDMTMRVKDEIIQEDPALLMYYDNAMMRTED